MNASLPNHSLLYKHWGGNRIHVKCASHSRICPVRTKKAVFSYPWEMGRIITVSLLALAGKQVRGSRNNGWVTVLLFQCFSRQDFSIHRDLPASVSRELVLKACVCHCGNY